MGARCYSRHGISNCKNEYLSNLAILIADEEDEESDNLFYFICTRSNFELKIRLRKVELDKYNIKPIIYFKEKYFLVITSLLFYKNIDLIVTLDNIQRIFILNKRDIPLFDYKDIKNKLSNIFLIVEKGHQSYILNSLKDFFNSKKGSLLKTPQNMRNEGKNLPNIYYCYKADNNLFSVIKILFKDCKVTQLQENELNEITINNFFIVILSTLNSNPLNGTNKIEEIKSKKNLLKVIIIDTNLNHDYIISENDVQKSIATTNANYLNVLFLISHSLNYFKRTSNNELELNNQKFRGAIKIFKDPKLFLEKRAILEQKQNSFLFFDSHDSLYSFLYLEVLNKLIEEDHLCGKKAKYDFLEICQEYGLLFHEEYLKGSIEQFYVDYFKLANIVSSNQIQNNAVYLYTRQSFLFYLLNFFFRTENFIGIFKMRYFIYNLNKQLQWIKKENHKKYKNNMEILKPDKLFRYSKIKKKEFEALKENQIIFMRGFVSASEDRNIANAFKYTNNLREDEIGIVYQINVNKDDEFDDLYYIMDYSESKIEKEILINEKNYVKIKKIISNHLNNFDISNNPNGNDIFIEVEYINNKNFFEKNILPDKFKEYHENLLRFTKLHYALDDFYLIKILLNLNKYHEASACLEKLHYIESESDMKDCPKYAKSIYSEFSTKENFIIKNNLFAECWFNIAKLFTNRKNKEELFLKALASYEYCREYFEKKKDYLNHSITLNNKASILKELHKYQESLFLYEESKQILLINKNKIRNVHYYMANTYNNIGTVMELLDRKQEALDNYILAINTFENCESKNLMRDYCIYYNNIALLYKNINKLDQAIYYLEKSRQIHLQNSNLKNFDYALLLHNLASVYKDLKRDQDALKYFIECLNIKQSLMEYEDPNLEDDDTIKKIFEILDEVNVENSKKVILEAEFLKGLEALKLKFNFLTKRKKC